MAKGNNKKNKPAEKPPEVKPEEVPMVMVYRVAKGRSLITKAGIRKPGETVKENWINGTLEDLFDKKYVTKKME